MKKRVFTLLLSLLVFLTKGQFSLNALPDFPGLVRDDAVAVYHKGKIYAGLGFSAGFFPLNDWWVFNISAQQWTQLPNAPFSARQYVRTFKIGNHIYFFGGWQSDQQFFNELWRFSTWDSTWKQMPSMPAAARWGAAAFSMGGMGYVGLGRDTTVTFSDFWRYNPDTGQWNRLPDFPGVSRSNCIGESINGRGVVGFGIHADHGQFRSLDDIWHFNPLSEKWTMIYEHTNDLSFMSAASLGDQLYLQGNYELPNHLDSTFRCFDLSTKQMINFGHIGLPQARGASMIAAQSSLYILWGLNNRFRRLASFYRIDFKEKQGNDFSVFPSPVYGGQCVVLFPVGQRSYQLYNLAGQLLDKGSIDKEAESLFLTLPIRNGTYLLVLADHKGEFHTLKLIRR